MLRNSESRRGSQPRRACQPLPEIDRQLVAECKSSNPRFGLSIGSRAPARAQSVALRTGSRMAASEAKLNF
jgi:hypothetical protein